MTPLGEYVIKLIILFVELGVWCYRLKQIPRGWNKKINCFVMEKDCKLNMEHMSKEAEVNCL